MERQRTIPVKRANGNPDFVDIYQRVHRRINTMGASHPTGRLELFLRSTGEPLSFVAKGRYKTIGNGLHPAEEITSDDPSAE